MPARLRSIMRAAEKLGATTSEPTSGSHWKIEKDGKMYPIPAHNGERSEISDLYIRGMCRALGIDEKELRKLL